MSNKIEAVSQAQDRSNALFLAACGRAGVRRQQLGADLAAAGDGAEHRRAQKIAIPRGYRLRPVEVAQTWLAAADISRGAPKGQGGPCGRQGSGRDRAAT